MGEVDAAMVASVASIGCLAIPGVVPKAHNHPGWTGALTRSGSTVETTRSGRAV